MCSVVCPALLRTCDEESADVDDAGKALAHTEVFHRGSPSHVDALVARQGGARYL